MACCGPTPAVFVGGFLTSLTPCVYPLIPITVRIFGARGDDVPRSRAIALGGAYVAASASCTRRSASSSALAGRAFGTFMANPWVMVPIALLFLAMAASMFGAFELALPSGAAAAPLERRRQGLRRRVRRWASSAASSPRRAPARCWRRCSPTSPPRARCCSAARCCSPTRSAWACCSSPSPRSPSRCPSRARWMEAVKSIFGVVMLVAALYFLRNVVAPLRSIGRAGSPAPRRQHRRWSLAGWRSARSICRFTTARRERAQGASASRSWSSGCFGVVAWRAGAQGRSGRARCSTWVTAKRRPGGGARARTSRRCSTSTPTGACRAKRWSSRPSSRAEVARELHASRWSRSTARRRRSGVVAAKKR